MSAEKSVNNLLIEKDEELIIFLKDKIANKSFIGFSKTYCKSLTAEEDTTKELIDKLNDKLLLHQSENIEIVLKLWKSLLCDTIVFLKSKDKRETYHDGETFGVNKLFNLMKAFKKFESILYGAGEYYRDHLAHMFRVYLLGDFLITNSFGYSIIDVGHMDFQEAISVQEKECMWCIIALTHDIGIALEKIDTINKHVENMVKEFGRVTIQELSYLFPPQCQIINEFLLKVISSNLKKNSIKLDSAEYITHIQSKYFLKYARAYERYDHGLISSSVLLRELVYFLETDFMLDHKKPLDKDDAKQFLIRQNILRSIASHNCNDIYHLNITNFPCLLVLIDEMQEWGRPRLSDIFKRNIPETSVQINKFNNSNIDYTIKFNCNKITTAEMEELKSGVLDYFIRKSQKYIKKFRSAVGGNPEIDPRQIDLSFKVIDDINSMISYKLLLPQPQEGADKLDLRILKNGNETTLYKLNKEVEKDISKE